MTDASSNGDALGLGSAARLLGVSAVTLRRWADAGRIECFRTPGGQRRFRRDDLERIRRGSDGDGGRVPRPPDAATAAQSEQARMFAALRNASRAITSSATSDEVLEVIARACCIALGTSDAIVFSYDPGDDTLQAQAIYEVAPTDYVKELYDPFPVDGYPGGRELLDVGGVLGESLSDPDLDPASRVSMLEYHEVASLSVGIRFGDQPLGLLVLTETVRERRFTEAERELAMALGEQAAIGLHTAQMFRRQEEQNRRLASLLESSRASTSSLVLEEVLGAVVRAAVSVLEVDGCVVWEYDGERDALVERSAYEISTDYEARDTVVMISDRPIDGEILRGRVPVVETLSDPAIDSLSRASMLEFGEKTCLSVPLWVGDEPLGLLVLLATHDERRFSDDELQLAQGLGEQAAVAMFNARTFRAQEVKNRHLTSLLDVGRALTSTIEIDEVLAIVARQATEALDSDECVIFEYDAEADTITARSFFSVGPSDYDEIGVVLPLDRYPEDRLLLERGAIVVESISDPKLSQAVRDSLVDYGEKTALSVPLRFGAEPLGIMALTHVREERHFTAAEIELARGLGEQAAAAIHNARLFAALSLRTRETGLLNEIARKATASLNVVEVARVTVDEISRLMEFDRASLTLTGDDGQLKAVFATEGAPPLLEGVSIDEAIAGSLAGLGLEAIVHECSGGESGPCSHPSLEGLQSVVLVGLTRDDAVIGVLALGGTAPRAFTTSDLAFLEGLGAHLSLAVNNATMFENIKVMHLGNLRALSSALNAKDYYTLGHTARVAAYAVLLAEELGWSQELIDQVEEIAYLHDIGKIAVSDRTLLKPGPLSDEEWELMREHPIISAEIIEPLLGEHLVAGVRHHHEYYDGSGYPDGLSGEGISPMARLLCVVDSYDAMSSLRLYRQALTYRECLRELENGKEIQFDPEMVDALVRVLEHLRELKGGALVAAWEAAVDIDAEMHTALADPATAGDAGQAAVGGLLGAGLRQHAGLSSLATEVRIDEHRSMIVAAVSDDPQRAARQGEILLADQEQMEAYAGRPLDTNVLTVDEHGAWVCGLAPISDDNGHIVGLVRAEVSATDVSGPLGTTSSVRQTFAGLARDAASRLMRVEIDSMIDGLSGLYNHRYLHERLSEEVTRAVAQGSELSLLFCDVDGFKEINDRFGHRVGDDVLRRISQLIAKAIRRIDLAARYGGDEFAVVLLDSSAEEAQEVAERIRVAITETALMPGGETPTVSIGIATAPGDASTKTELLDKADWAMYLAKRRGRNRVVRFSDG